MKKRLFLSVTAVVAVMLSFITAMPVTVSAEAVAEVTAEPKILSFANESDIKFDGTGSLYYTTTSQTAFYASTVTSSSYSGEESALKLSYADKLELDRNGTKYQTGRYRFLPCFTEKNVIGTDYKYVSVLYKTTTNAAHTLWIQKRANANLKMTGSAVSNVADEWVYTPPIDVSGYGVFIDGFNNRNDMLFSFDTTDTSAEFYIKELAFFKSADDAAIWYADIDSYLGSTIKDPVVISLRNENETSGNAEVYYHNSDPTQTGNWTYDTGKQALAVTYTDAEMKIGSFTVGNYRFSPKFKAKNILGSTYKYACVVYMTDAADWTLHVHNTGSGASKLRLDAVTQNAQSNKWLITDPINLAKYTGTGSFLTRMNSGAHLLFAFTAKEQDATFYIKEIAFFNSEASAEAWYENASFESVKPTVKDEPIIISLRSASDTAKTGKVYYHTADPTQTGTWVYDGKERALAVKYVEEDADMKIGKFAVGKYRFTPCFTNKDTLGDAYRYARVLYKTDTASGYKLYIHNPKATNLRLEGITKNPKVNEWVVTEPIDLATYGGAGSYMTRLNSGAHLVFGFSTDDTEATFNIKEIAFFKSLEDAEAWYYDIDSYVSSEEKYNPVIISLRSEADTVENGALYVHEADSSETGTWSYDRAEKALAVTYTDSTVIWGDHELGNYRFAPHFTDTNVLGDNYKYACVLYKTTASEWDMHLHNPGSPNVRIPIVTKNKAADTWLVTAPINLTQYNCSILDRYNSGTHCTFAFSIGSAKETFYIKEVAFFQTAKEATQWYSNLSEYLAEDAEDKEIPNLGVIMMLLKKKLGGDSNSSRDIESIILSLRSSADTAKNGKVYHHKDDPTQTGTWTYNTEEKALAVSYTNETEDMKLGRFSVGKYRFTPCFTTKNVLSEEYKYACVVYKTTSEADYKLYIHNPKATNLRLEGVTNKKAVNKWLVTEPIDFSVYSSSFMTRLNSGAHLVFGFETGDKNAVFLIKEVAFFKNESDAVKFYKGLESYIATTDQLVDSEVQVPETPGGAIAPEAPSENIPTNLNSAPVTLSFASRERFETNATLYVHAADPIEGGIYEFKDGALTLKYSKLATDWQGEYRVMFCMETTEWLKADHRYVQVTYRTDAESGELRFHNNGTTNGYTVVSPDVSVSGGEWITTKPMEFHETMLTRLNKGRPVTLGLHTDDENIRFEVKEIKILSAASILEDEEIAAASKSDERVIWNTTSVENFKNSGAGITVRGVASYKFDKIGENQALKLQYQEHELGNYRVMLNPTSTAVFEGSDTWYIRVTYKTNAVEDKGIVLTNNKNNNQVTLNRGIKALENGFCITAPTRLPDDFVARLRTGMWMTYGFDYPDADVDVYISEVAFFTSEDEACSYYGDTTVAELKEAGLFGIGQVSMKLYDTSVSAILGPDAETGLGVWERDPVSNNVHVKWLENNTSNWGHYRFMPKFTEVTPEMAECRYVRIVYRATHPEGQTEPVALKILSNAKSSILTVDGDVKNTNGEWVMSPVQELSDVIHSRWLNTEKNMHCTVSFFATVPGGDYEVKEILFFDTYEKAAGYRTEDNYIKMSISDTAISEYVIVISENAAPRTTAVAQAIRSHIFNISGITLDIVSDSTEVKANEILVGNTNRQESQTYYNGKNGKYITGELTTAQYAVSVANGKLVVTAGTEIALEEGATAIIETYLTPAGNELAISDDFNVTGSAKLMNYRGTWDDPAPVADPEVFTDDFSDAERTDSYFVEAYATNNWKVEGGVYGTKATDFTYTRLHVYERDIDYTAKIRFNELNENSDAGLLARYNDTNAYIRVGYKNGEWYLRYSEGIEFNVYTLDTAAANIAENNWYTVRVVVQKNEVKVYIDGKLTLSSTYVSHITPGPMGMFAENADVSFDDVSVTLVSGQGKVMRGVVDSTFPAQENYLSSGSVIEMADGTLRYVHSDESQHRVSHDGGLTWEKEVFTDVTTDCINIFRLASGKLIKLMEEKVDGKLAHVSYTSEDDGVTWTRGGTVAYHDYKDYGTMMQTIENDKFTQMSNGRIFLSQNYQGTIPAGEPNEKLRVFNELYYSDDEGKTWIKCKQSSFDCTDIAYFGESKVIEAADGALIWMTPWNTAGYIIASESTDGGETWGQFYNMLEFPNSTSSFGIMRDPYADNNTTYYMSFIYGESTTVTMPRNRLCIAKTTDGRNWTFLGDVYRFENNLRGANGSSSTALINHIVDPFLTVTEDYIFVGSGFSMRRNYQNNGFHNNQQQYIYRIEKSMLAGYDKFPKN